MGTGNRMGLTILYDPAKPPTKTRPNVDFVLVHGLNGGYTKTWTCTTGDSDVTWPKDLLPGVQPQTRVLSFGYSGDVYKNPSHSGIRDIARSLLSSLKLRRHSDRDRPIVFLGHCLGGLIVKQALCFANNEDEYCSIAKATHSVLFFGTPHFGASEQNWLSIAAAFKPLAQGKEADESSIVSPIKLLAEGKEADKPSILVEMLVRKARDLAEISEDFCQRSPRYKLKTFYEELPFPSTENVIVDKMDTRMFLHNEVSKGVHAHHLSMVQFEDEDDDTFLHVCQYISEAVVAVEEKVTPPPYTWARSPPHTQSSESLEERAAKEKVLRELAKAMAALQVDNRQGVHRSLPPARGLDLTFAPPHKSAKAQLLLESPKQGHIMPWETGKAEEEVPVRVQVRRPHSMPEPEEEGEMEAEGIVIDAPLRVETQPKGVTPPPLWNRDACVSDEDIDDDDDDDELNDGKPLQPLVRDEPDQRQKVNGIHLQDDDDDGSLDEGKSGPSLVQDGPDRYQEVDKVHLKGDSNKTFANVAVSAVDKPRSYDTEPLAQNSESQTPTAKGFRKREHRRISWLFSKVRRSEGKVQR